MSTCASLYPKARVQYSPMISLKVRHQEPPLQWRPLWHCYMYANPINVIARHVSKLSPFRCPNDKLRLTSHINFTNGRPRPGLAKTSRLSPGCARLAFLLNGRGKDVQITITPLVRCSITHRSFPIISLLISLFRERSDRASFAWPRRLKSWQFLFLTFSNIEQAQHYSTVHKPSQT